MVSWQTVLQEYDDEMEDCTPTFNNANKQNHTKRSNNKAKLAFSFPHTFASPAGYDMDALSANLSLANQQPFLSSTQQCGNSSVLHSQ